MKYSSLSYYHSIFGFVKNIVDFKVLSSLTLDVILHRSIFTDPWKQLELVKSHFVVRSGSQLSHLRGRNWFLKRKCLFTLNSSELGRDQEGNHFRLLQDIFKVTSFRYPWLNMSTSYPFLMKKESNFSWEALLFLLLLS